MDIFEVIQRRRTVRKFLDLPVEWEKIGNIIIGAHYAPSAGNIQNWRFVVVTDKEKRRKVADACLKQYWIEEAPVIIIIGSDPHEMERYYDERGKLYDTQSCAAAAAHMLLLAEDQDLKGCWVGAFEEDMLKQAVEMPDNIRPHMVLVIGYSEEDPPVPEKYHISDLTYINKWGNKIANMDLVLDNWSSVVQKKFWEAREATLKKSGKLGTRLMMHARKHAKAIDEKVRKAKEDAANKKKIKQIKNDLQKKRRSK